MKKLLPFAGCLLVTASAIAGDFSQPVQLEDAEIADPDGWEFQFRPYLWLADMEGSVAAMGSGPQDIEVSFGDWFSVTKFAWASTFEARPPGGKWSFFLDTMYLNLGPDAPIPPAPNLFRATRISVEQTLIDGWIGYRVCEWDRGWCDIIGGLRYQGLDIGVDAVLGGANFRSFNQSKDWLDPHIGFRVRHGFNDRWYCQGGADIGGFSVGSDLSIEAMAGVGYFLADWAALELSYRFLGVDYSDGGFEYDVDTHGIFTGIAFYF